MLSPAEVEQEGSMALLSKANPLPVSVLVAGSVQPPEMGREFAGLLIPDQESTLSFEGDGRITEILVQEGDCVNAGDTIARLDQSHLDAKERRIKSELAAANARLDELVAGPRLQTIAAARAKVDELQARVELAKVEAKRQEQLVPRGATSRSERDAAVFGLKAEENNLLAASALLEELSEGTRAEQIAEQRARCAAIQASLDEVAAERTDATVVAPFDGRIEQRMVDEGTVVSPGVPVLRIVSHRVEAEVGLPPDVAQDLTPGQRVSIRLRGVEREGWIDRLEPSVRSQTRTRVVFVRFERETKGFDGIEEDHSESLQTWVAGEVIGLRGVETSDKPRGSQFWLPSDALSRSTRGLWNAMVVVPSDQGPDVFVCESRAVELLRTDGSMVLVKGMLEEGENVIADGLHRVTSGMRVKIIRSTIEAKS
ncbi:MAG: HlyD family efflux transporter periplasmic adaptor subunit [Planctomycetota bacterium]